MIATVLALTIEQEKALRVPVIVGLAGPVILMAAWSWLTDPVLGQARRSPFVQHEPEPRCPFEPRRHVICHRPPYDWASEPDN